MREMNGLGKNPINFNHDRGILKKDLHILTKNVGESKSFKHQMNEIPLHANIGLFKINKEHNNILFRSLGPLHSIPASNKVLKNISAFNKSRLSRADEFRENFFKLRGQDFSKKFCKKHLEE